MVAKVDTAVLPERPVEMEEKPNHHSILDIQNKYKKQPPEPKTRKEELKEYVRKTPKKAKHFLLKHFPIASFIRTYKRPCLLHDVAAGLAVCGLHFPQGLAYGILAGLTPSVGLISTFFPVILYVFFGTSPHCSLGTNAVVSIMVRDIFNSETFRERQNTLFPMLNANLTNANMTDNAIESLEEDLMRYKTGLAAGASLYCGCVFFLMHFFQLGFIVSYLSHSLVGGFTTAAGIHIFSSQITLILGITIPPFRGDVGKLIHVYRYAFHNITDMNAVTLVMSLSCIVVLLVVKVGINGRFKDKLVVPIPIDLIVLILGTIVGHFLQLNRNHNVNIIGSVQTGIPAPAVPILEPIDLLFLEALEIALITFFLNISTLKFLGQRNEYEVDEQTEMYSYGIVNVISSFFHSMPASVAPPRSVLLSDMHGKTTLNGIFTSAIMLVFIYWVGTYLASCPMCVLAAMVMVGVKDLILQVTTLPFLWRHNKRDVVIWLTTFLASVFLDLKYGLICGVLVSFFSVINQSQKGKIVVLGRIRQTDLYLNIETHDSINEVAGIKILRMESSLYFATAERFRQYVYASIMHPVSQADVEAGDDDFFSVSLASMNEFVTRDLHLKESESHTDLESIEEEAPDNQHDVKLLYSQGKEVTFNFSKSSNDLHIRSLVLDCSCITYVDMNGLDILRRVVKDLNALGVSTYLARCTTSMLKMMEKSDIYKTVLKKNNVFIDLPDAIRHIQTAERKISAYAKLLYLQNRRCSSVN